MPDEPEDKKVEEKKEGLSNEKLLEVVRFVHQQNQALQAKVTKLEGERKEEEPENRRTEPREDTDAHDLEVLSRKDFLNVIVDTVKKQVGGPLEQKIQSVHEGGERSRISSEIQDVRGRYDDFDQFRQETGDVIKENPNLSIEEAYLIARARTPDKASEVDREREERAAKERKDKEAEERGEFGGLFPTNSQGAERDTMDVDEALAKAYDEVVAPYEHLLN